MFWKKQPAAPVKDEALVKRVSDLEQQERQRVIAAFSKEDYLRGVQRGLVAEALADALLPYGRAGVTAIRNGDGFYVEVFESELWRHYCYHWAAPTPIAKFRVTVEEVK